MLEHCSDKFTTQSEPHVNIFVLICRGESTDDLAFDFNDTLILLLELLSLLFKIAAIQHLLLLLVS